MSCRFYWRALFTASSILPPNLFLTVFGQFAVQSIVKIRRCILATENYGWWEGVIVFSGIFQRILVGFNRKEGVVAQ